MGKLPILYMGRRDKLKREKELIKGREGAMSGFDFSPKKIAKIDGRIKAIIWNLNKRFPSMLVRMEWDDLFQEGRLFYLEASKVYTTDKPRFRFVKYAIMTMQAPRGQDRFEHVSVNDEILTNWVKATYIVDLLDLVKGLAWSLKKIVLKKLNGMALTKKEQKRFQRAMPELRKIWVPYYKQLKAYA